MEESESLLKALVPDTYIQQGLQGLAKRYSLFKQLLEHRRLPEKGWDDATIELVLHELALMDSNNFVDNVGVGEREARVYSSLVSRRHYRFGHGMGRSGDIAEPQPKAAGSSLLVKLTNMLVLDALHVAGISREVSGCLVLPLATGMGVALSLLSLRPSKPTAQYVVWPRIDQNSCLKAVLTAGLTPVVVPLRQVGDELVTDVEAVERAITLLGSEAVLCVLSTTSCFAPRAPDAVGELAQLCYTHNVAHVVNNAYGLQCSKVVELLNSGLRRNSGPTPHPKGAHKGAHPPPHPNENNNNRRVDVVVQSGDKNFLVPVGGSVLFSPDPEVLACIGKSYPGRASSSPIQDLFITLLSMGRGGYARLLSERRALVPHFREGLGKVAAKHGERLLHTPHNTISFAITLQHLCAPLPPAPPSSSPLPPPSSSPSAEPSSSPPMGPSFLGSMLFMRCVSGTRVVVPNKNPEEGGGEKAVGPLKFKSYGAHCDAYFSPYLTAACALGVTKEEVDEFLKRLDKTMAQFCKRRKGRKGEEEGQGGKEGQGKGEGEAQEEEAGT